MQVLDDSVAGHDEGRAMAQIVHDLAPGARLAFATASSGVLAFADNIRDLAAANSDVIVDDVTYFDEPFFQDGPLSVAVKDVVDDGVTYVSHGGQHQHHLRRQQRALLRGAGVSPDALRAAAELRTAWTSTRAAAADATYGIRVPAGRTLNSSSSGPSRGTVSPPTSTLPDDPGNTTIVAGSTTTT